MNRVLIAILCTLILTLLQSAGAHAAPDEDEIVEAVRAMKQYLHKKQNRGNGGWEQAYANSVQAGGETALVTLALLLAGEPMQHPQVDHAIRFLDDFPMRGTYAVGMRSSVWAQLPNEYQVRLNRDVRWLLDAHDGRGRYSYQPKPERFDHSATQYGVLGVWEAAKRGAPVPDRYWDRLKAHFLATQNPDGGWGYQPGHPSTGSMTAAGLTVLFIVQQQRYRKVMLPPKDIADAIDRGVAWLDENFTASTNPGSGGHLFYYLYSIERVALASGMRAFNGRDWFAAGAEVILQRQRDDGSISSNPIDTAFALMFLARGRRPVWISKLAVAGSTWNNRPNDLHYLTRYLSELTETDMNWQAVRDTSSLDDWLSSPVLYIASDRAIAWSPAQQNKLREYVLRGGTIVVNPDLGSSQLPASMRLWAANMFPDYRVRELPASHWIFNDLHQVPNPDSVPMHGLSNGARELMIIAERDLGYRFQADDSPSTEPAWRIGANLWSHLTDRGLLPARQAEQSDLPALQPSEDVVTIGRARYTGNWSAEPLAWDAMAPQIRFRGGVTIETAPVELASLPRFAGPIVHLSGVDAVNLSAAELLALDRYAHNGGTVVVETIGGEGDFAIAVEKQLIDIYGQAALPLGTDHPIVTGEGLIGGYNATFSPFRRYTVLRRATPPWPHLAAYMVDGRPAIIFSRDDLSLGMLNVRHWGIHGHEPDAVGRLMTNLVLWIDAQQRGQSEVKVDQQTD